MQVILTNSVRKLGQIGDTVEVADGYGRNYLIPQKLAVRASDSNIKNFSCIKKELEKKNVERKNLAESAAKELQGQHLTFVAPSAADGRLFGSVNVRTLATKISELAKIKLDYSNILLGHPIKFNGVYNIEIVLHPEVVTSVVVVVAKTDSEARDALLESQGSTKDHNAQNDVTTTQNSDNHQQS